MQGNGPLNRKKKVTGTAHNDSMQTNGPVQTDAPVGDAQGYRERKEQHSAPADQRASVVNQLNQNARPMARPKGTTGQAAGSMNTQGPAVNGARPQQTRPAGAQQSADPFTAMRPSQTYQQPPQARPQQTTASSTPTRASGKRSPLLLIVIAAVLLLSGGGGLSGLFGGGDSGSADLPSTGSSTSSQTATGSQSSASSLLQGLLGSDSAGDSAYSYNNSSSYNSNTNNNYNSNTNSSYNSQNSSNAYTGSTGYGSAFSAASDQSSSSVLQQLLGGSWYGTQTGYAPSPAQTYTNQTTQTAQSYSQDVITGVLNRSVASGSRNKYTSILGNGRDTVTIMVYMCGADLESRSAMGTKDLQEMLSASFGSNVRLIIHTGGSTNWRNNLVSSSVNQVWQIQNGKMNCLKENAGTASMTNPATLSAFIQYCAKNFQANRYALILWDHGSGSVSGYGYDEKNPRTGSMSLAGMNTAFQEGGVKFDFIGFDACLMATVENALMASKYADYLIASEETEPGIGWYYTNWLTALGQNTSLPTLDIGKQICDDFVAKCSTACRGQQTTLSVIDLAELEHTVPSKLADFSRSVTTLISNQEYRAVSNARNGCREFATSSRIDQVDLTDLCFKLNTQESAALAQTLREAVKYNRINNISNAHGLSIYFPYNKVSSVDKAVSNYAAIGMDDSYAQAIRAFASVEASGQAVTGGTSSAIPSLFGALGGGSSASSEDMIGELLSAFLGGGFGGISGLDSGNTGFLSGRGMSQEELTSYLTANLLDRSRLAFQQAGENWVLDLPAEQWALVTGVDQNAFYDNGRGYLDLGLDNLFEFDEQGRLVADMDGTWLAINGQPVAYYHETSQYLSDGGWIITGRVPALLNGEQVDLMIVFDNESEDGYVAGARAVYGEEVETVAKAIDALEAGDTIQFLADLYDYDQNYTASHQLGDAITVEGELQVSNVYLPDASKLSVTYRITDIYNQNYWTPVIGK